MRWPSRPCATAAGAGSGAGCGGLARCLLARGGALGGLRGLGGLRRGLLLRGSVLADGRLAHRRLARAGPAGGRSALAAQFGGQLLDAVAPVREVVAAGDATLGPSALDAVLAHPLHAVPRFSSEAGRVR